MHKQHSPECAVFHSKACTEGHVFSVKATITAILLCLLVLPAENRFQQVYVQPKIAPLNGTLLVSLVFLRPLLPKSSLHC